MVRVFGVEAEELVVAVVCCMHTLHSVELVLVCRLATRFPVRAEVGGDLPCHGRLVEAHPLHLCHGAHVEAALCGGGRAGGGRAGVSEKCLSACLALAAQSYRLSAGL